MPKATRRIEHGMINKDGKNEVVVLEAGDEAKGKIPDDAIKSLQAIGAIEADASKSEAKA